MAIWGMRHNTHPNHIKLVTYPIIIFRHTHNIFLHVLFINIAQNQGALFNNFGHTGSISRWNMIRRQGMGPNE